ncbi:MAG: hypothetical protein VKJ31_02415 [Synechococcus sp.]|nr:hypothetical protein [Synechococcus sp.]
MSATPLRLPLQTLRRAVAPYTQAPLQLAGWSLGGCLLLQLLAWLPLPVLLQSALMLLLIGVVFSGLLAVMHQGLDATKLRWRQFLQPLRRAPVPLLLLPLLVGSLSALASLALLLPGMALLLLWSLSMPVLLDQGGEAWDAMGASADLVRHQWRQLLPGLLLLWLITLISAALGWWLLGLWLPLAAFLLQDFYCSAKG